MKRMVRLMLCFFPWALSAEAGVKTRWTVEVYNLDHHPQPSPDCRLYAKPLTLSLLNNGAHVSVGGGYNPVAPLGPQATPTGDFKIKLIEAESTSATIRLSVWDRTQSPRTGFNAVFETDSELKVGVSRRVYFTHGNFASGTASRYELRLRLDQVEACEDFGTCLTGE